MLSAATPGTGITAEAPAPKPRYSFRKLTWSDEFNYTGRPDSTKWRYEVGGDGWGNKEQQYYTNHRPENARVEGGYLLVEARREALMPGNAYTSARLVSRGPGGSQTYGRFEVRARLPAGRGTWPAIWMLPDENTYGNKSWPDNGEIDIMEHVGYDANVVHATTHCKTYFFRLNNQKTGTTLLPDATTAFHTYAVEWTPETITAEVDGQLYFATRNEGTGWEAWPWNKPFHLLLNVAVGGEWGGLKGIDEAAFPQRLEVDYVRFYALKKE
ncbi:glycoside hydrolase family 16 protein [Hymenobacter rubripertinctus]|uniref:Glycoside hydrolase family 16 protein n=2 Tax=Hymenobacter rubripertinctus TaxID=2029981 RepID=A0A418R6Q0_9BACT|nr:glycoside hydrolase family 16 protein [Hymenobacter rubripertinctus]RIY12974.1 glycoside hydrolase family 16 protein [Hymenobacter rubripertinctus]